MSKNFTISTFLHTGIYCADIEASIKFYTEVLPGKVTLRWDNENDRVLIAMIQLPNGMVELLQPYEESEKNRCIAAAAACPNHLAFHVDNIDEAASWVESLGYKFDEERVYPLNNVGYIDGNNIRIGFFRGPNGERIEFSADA